MTEPTVDQKSSLDKLVKTTAKIIKQPRTGEAGRAVEEGEPNGVVKPAR